MSQKISNILEQIITTKRQEVVAKKRTMSIEQIREACFAYLAENKTKNSARSLKKAILDGKPLGLIAEIKLASPIAGQLSEMNYIDIAKLYAISRADVISVLTDATYFHGHLSYLKKVREICPQPIFRKDFIIDPYQIYETALAGADAFLLIASVLTRKELINFIQLGKELGLECLIEIHNEDDLQKALQAGAEIIGINNRDSITMKIDLKTTERLAKQIPKGKIIISESGINDRNDVEKIIETGVRDILVGTAIIKSKDMIEKINELKK